MAETTLYNQDCRSAMQQINAESIDLIVTDPPYNLGNFMKKRDTVLRYFALQRISRSGHRLTAYGEDARTAEMAGI